MIVRVVNDTENGRDEFAEDYDLDYIPGIGDAFEVDEELYLIVGIVHTPESDETDVVCVVTNEECDHC